ncbi:hypothetical protein SLEP1_g52736 [Rubroshorea leprosula]|uniref:Uncharacterized protein n=1 Tax=Rubroshorea leprosula TaxID=152421 RepID=A0AAV5M9W7_9ROSI|nr:hypothetical protein SLEP1_g52736 [Rubroshorea leprosula]
MLMDEILCFAFCCSFTDSPLPNKMMVTLKWPRLVARLRAELNCARECLEKQKAKVKRKEIKCVKRRKRNEFFWKEDACIRHGIDLNLGILDAEDEGDFVRADHLRQSRRELVAKHMEETQVFLNGALN